ncbi:carbamoyltransferase HypF [Immundisolibacter sp.]|uniref:carbamoyltransferase HypF n=1 Tax=Immundisolibacter sp. TaxID=1934948 RepID=UPI003F8724B9
MAWSVPAARRLRIRVHGAVQGVGFRPQVYRLATALGLSGSVRNARDGVQIEAQGTDDALEALLAGLRRLPPPVRVAGLECDCVPPAGDDGFVIAPSETGPGAALPLPDLAPCADCLAELRDPADRRHAYPFLSCTACGPRYSIIDALPYDRERTAMAAFTPCAACAAEYADPLSRRFQHQANACPACGPRLTFCNAAGTERAQDGRALAAAAAVLRAGGIVALKGLGGFQLLTDARDPAAVARLRARKHRPHKPLAVMFPDLAAVRAACRTGAAEQALLQSPAAPIVLLDARPGALAADLAPDNPRLGAMLPSTPLHVLLLQELGFALVATSGNASGEPLCADNAQALSRLAGIADAFLLHDRAILQPVDDSVVQRVAGQPQTLRLARGLAPLALAREGPGTVLALGGHLKNALAVGGAGRIVVGPHLGDLDTTVAQERFMTATARLPALAGGQPMRLACDLHPDYASSRWAAADPRPRQAVQHHHAHLAAVLAEHAIAGEVLGVAFDGAGLGADGTLWGGEFLHGDSRQVRRVARWRPFPLPGGERAAREPRRSALGLLYAAYGRDLGGESPDLRDGEQRTLLQALDRGVNTPLTGSVGRLFDAVAALLGLCQVMSFEGQAAQALQAAAERAPRQTPYPLELVHDGDGWLIDWRPMLTALLAERAAGRPVARIAARFHATVAAAVVEVAQRLHAGRVVLCGGCFQNRRLLGDTRAVLEDAGIAVWWPVRLPPGDGALACGQAAVVMARPGKTVQGPLAGVDGAN